MPTKELTMNQIEIAGKVDKGFILAKTSTDKFYTRFRLAWEGERDKLWIGVTWFGGDAAKALSDSNPAYVQVRGRLITNSWDDKATGKKVYEIKIMAASVIPYKAMDSEDTTVNGRHVPEPDEDIPF